MFCPACKDSVLTMSERQGVEIDYCPKCRGVWLDRGELDKIIEKSATVMQPAAAPIQQNQNYKSEHEYKGYKRRKSFLEEIFD